MIGLDTNVLVRYLAQDDAKQSAIATRFIESELSATQPGFISLVVLVEVCWVLQRLYAATSSECTGTVEDLLGSAQFVVEQRHVVQAAAQQMRSHPKGQVGFTDVLIVEIGKAQGCAQTVSFDKGAVRSAGMTLLT
ncbi:PIN domain-containing protein [Rhodoferax sp.]|uniref:PIN domain-containing protein n=1 Tax=Rhodoferax sp. TaxID=50421 RepID=UPI00374DB0DA